jgi:predicted porin
MNKKLIAAAVSAAVMAPVVQADVVVYGRIHNAIEFTDVGDDDSNVDLTGINSRFGVKASSDMGNGLTGSARYEFSTTTDKEGNGIEDTRLAFVGLSGGFGTVQAGNIWSAFSATAGTHMDPTFTVAYDLYSSFAGGPYRSSNTIKYSNSFGPVYLELDVRLNDSDERSDVAEKLNGNGVGLGMNFNATDNLLFALAFDSEDGSDASGALPATLDEDRIGAAVQWSGDRIWASLGWYENDNGINAVDVTQAWLGTSFGDNTSAMIGYGSGTEDASDAEPNQLTVGVYHNMGGGFNLMYEGTAIDGDTWSADKDRHVFSMRLDF